MGRVEEILKKYGPMLSGKLANILEKNHSISNEAARQAISRARAPVQKLKVFPFNKNQVFCYLEEQYNSRLYRDKLYESLKKESLAVAVILHALENTNNIMKKSMLPIYSKSPIENTKGHRKFERMVSDLVGQGILYDHLKCSFPLSAVLFRCGKVPASSSYTVHKPYLRLSVSRPHGYSPQYSDIHFPLPSRWTVSHILSVLD